MDEEESLDRLINDLKERIPELCNVPSVEIRAILEALIDKFKST